jgi:methylmalonyl-CoA carboxyltransferase large subunit
MSSKKADIPSILTALEAIRNDLQGLDQRVAAMEARQTQDAGLPTDPELALALSAAIAAYLGEKPRIRQIRLVSGVPWVHQGRATIQASHALVQETTRRSP